MSIKITMLKRGNEMKVVTRHLKLLTTAMRQGSQLMVTACKEKMVEYRRNVGSAPTMKSIHAVRNDDPERLSFTIGGNRNLELVMKGTPPEPKWRYNFPALLWWVQHKGIVTRTMSVYLPGEENGDGKTFKFRKSTKAVIFFTTHDEWVIDKKTGKRQLILGKNRRLGARLANGTTVTLQGVWDPELSPDIPGGNGRKGSDTWGNYGSYQAGDRIGRWRARGGKTKVADRMAKQEQAMAAQILKELREKGTLRWRGLQPDPIADGIKESYKDVLALVTQALRLDL